MIRIRGLCKNYGKKEVLKHLDLDILDGETLVILGRSGVGKSVLLKQIIGLEFPTSGEISIDGVPVSDLRDRERSAITQHMGMLFQAGALFDSMTVAENTAFYLFQHRRRLGLSREEMNARVSDALAMVDMAGTEQLFPSDLSGGMKKRVALARLIVYHPKILLYDEPTTGLDPITAMQINELILATQRELRATSIVVTHDLCSAFHIADRIALHHEGRILYIRPKETFPDIEDELVKNFLRQATPKGYGHG